MLGIGVPAALQMRSMARAEMVLLEPAHGVAGLWWAYPIGFGAMLLMHAGYCVFRSMPRSGVRVVGYAVPGAGRRL